MPELPILDYPRLGAELTLWLGGVGCLVWCVREEIIAWRAARHRAVRHRPAPAGARRIASAPRLVARERCDWCGQHAPCTAGADVLDLVLGELVPTRACPGCRTIVASATARVSADRSW